MNMYASIKNMLSFQEHLQKPLLLQSAGVLSRASVSFMAYIPWATFDMEDPSKRWPLLPCDSHVLGRFSFLIPKNKFSHHLGCGKVWPNMANGTLTKISLDRWIPRLHDGCFLLQN